MRCFACFSWERVVGVPQSEGFTDLLDRERARLQAIESNRQKIVQVVNQENEILRKRRKEFERRQREREERERKMEVLLHV